MNTNNKNRHVVGETPLSSNRNSPLRVGLEEQIGNPLTNAFENILSKYVCGACSYHNLDLMLHLLSIGYWNISCLSVVHLPMIAINIMRKYNGTERSQIITDYH